MNTITSPERQGYRDFDLPKEHLSEVRHYVPPKTHDPAETARRRDLTPGTLLAETQLQGLVVAGKILELVTDEEGLVFATNTLAVAGLNTAWYSYAQNSDVMRRRLKLPLMIHPRNRTPDTILDDSKAIIANRVVKAGRLVEATDYMMRNKGDLQRQVGVGVGNASLRLAMFEPVLWGVFDGVGDTDTLAQDMTRRRCLEVLESARTMHATVGSHPSIAQLSDPYSHLSVYWHRHAPGNAQKAIVEALAVS